MRHAGVGSLDLARRWAKRKQIEKTRHGPHLAGADVLGRQHCRNGSRPLSENTCPMALLGVVRRAPLEGRLGSGLRATTQHQEQQREAARRKPMQKMGSHRSPGRTNEEGNPISTNSSRIAESMSAEFAIALPAGLQHVTCCGADRKRTSRDVAGTAPQPVLADQGRRRPINMDLGTSPATSFAIHSRQPCISSAAVVTPIAKQAP